MPALSWRFSRSGQLGGFPLLSALLLAALLLPGCTSAGSTSQTAPFIIGADLSAVQASEDRGVHYSDHGAPQDIFSIMKAHGFNYVRLRVFVEPTNPGGYNRQGYCDLPHTITMAKRVKAAGLGLLIDFHYSDTWADPGKQTKPLAWRALAFPELVQKVHDYTKDAVAQLKAAGATPDMVQIGNEITPGMLLNRLPAGGRGGGAAQNVSTQPEGSTKDWDNLAALLKAGIAGAREVDAKILIMLHIDKGGNNAVSRTWIDNALSRGVSFDILGESCYSVAKWQGPASGWKANFTDLAQRFPQLKFVIAEYGYHDATTDYAHDIREANDVMLTLPGKKGVGTFIWEPTQNSNGQSMFDRTGAALPVLATYDEVKKQAAAW